MKDPWFDNIRAVKTEEAVTAVRAHTGSDAWRHWHPNYPPAVLTVIEPPKKLREALTRGR